MAGPTIKFAKDAAEDEYRRQRVSDWPDSKVVGKIAAMKGEFHGAHRFDGVKRLAFERMLRFGLERGRTIVLVLPVSPAYSKEFMPLKTAQDFEQTLTDLQNKAPRSEWLRLDRLPGLATSENFCDLDHLNSYGRQIASEAFRTWLMRRTHEP